MSSFHGQMFFSPKKPELGMMIKLSFTRVQTLTSSLQMAAALSEIVECVIWKQSCHMQEKAHWHASLICDKDKRGMYL
jgi:hypothetical protein